MSTLTALALVLFALGSCEGGCDCAGSKPTPPTSAQERRAAFASKIPAQSDVALFFTDMPGVRQTLKSLVTHTKSTLPIEAYRREIRDVTGIDLLDEKTFSAAGIAPDGGFAFAVWRGQPVLLLYVSDQDAFRETFIGSIAKRYRTSPPAKDEASGVWTTSGPRASLSWKQLSDDGLTLLVVQSDTKLPTTAVDDSSEDTGTGGQADAGGDMTSAQVLARVLDAADEPLSEHPKWEPFVAKVGDKWPASAFVSTPRLLAMYKDLDPALEAYQKEVIDAVAGQIEWTGLGWIADDASARGGIYLGVKPQTLEAFEGLDKPEKKPPNFKVLVQDRAYAFVRTSISAEIFWREYQKLIPPRQLAFIKKIFANIKSTTKIDIEADLIDNATGHVGLAIYGIDLAKMNERRAAERMKTVAFAAHIQVEDPQKLETFLERIIAELHGAIVVRSVPGGITRYGFNENSSTAPPFALYVSGDLVTLASTTISEDVIRKAIVGDGVALAKQVPGTVSQSLLTDDRATGLYVSLARIREKLASLGGGIVKELLGPTDSLALRLELDEGGLIGHGEIVFARGKGGSDSAQPAPGPDAAAPSPGVDGGNTP